MQPCTHLPSCPGTLVWPGSLPLSLVCVCSLCVSVVPVDGGWSAWTPFTSCPVTCGVGLQLSDRKCNSPAPVHGGRPCPGEQRRSRLCQTSVHCPGTQTQSLSPRQQLDNVCVCAVDGVWSTWSEWSPCKSPFGQRDVRCLEQRGSQKRRRECLHRAHNGAICGGETQSQTQACYDVHRCPCRWRRHPPLTLAPQRCHANGCLSSSQGQLGRLDVLEPVPARLWGEVQTPPETSLQTRLQPIVSLVQGLVLGCMTTSLQLGGHHQTLRSPWR